ncbi:MAG: ATP-binding protein [Caldilineaceae bacterium]
MKRYKTIRARFTLWIAIWLLAILAAFAAYVYHKFSGDLADSVDNTLRFSAAQTLTAINVENGQINIADAISTAPARSSLAKHDLTFRVLDAEGKVLRAFGEYPNLPITANSLSTAQRLQASFVTVYAGSKQDAVRMYTMPIVSNGKLIGIIQIAQNMGDLRETLQRLLGALMAGGTSLVLIGAVGGYFLVARALAPVDYITRTAQRISAEDLSARLNLPTTTDEVGRLATTLDAMLARLEASFRRERQFTADASHELRTPLTAMQAILGVIRAERRTPEDYEQALSDLSEETDRLRSMVEDLLRLARGDVRKNTTRERVDLSLLLMDVSDSMAPLAEAKGLTLTCTVPAELTVQGDTDDLIRLFVNLLDNAVKYTEQGAITVTARTDAHCIRVMVSDTGIGIPPEHLPHIFDRFYRVDSARTSQGAGLGLALALEIARAHGGDIQVDSTTGQGTTFTVNFPI